LVDRAERERRSGGQRERVVAGYQQALRHWCAAVELGAEIGPNDVLDWFGIAAALDDMASAQFVATLPTTMWDDDSLEALQARALLCLFLGDFAHAKEFVDELVGRLLNDAQQMGVDSEAAARMLHALTRADAGAFAEARRRAAQEFAQRDAQRMAPPFWTLRLRGFDAVARTLGMP
jgi:hypothetical protein